MPPSRQQEVAFTRVVLFGSSAISVVLALVATLRDELEPGALLALLAVIGLLWWLVGALDRRGRAVTWMMSLGVLNLVLVVPEMALRVSGFRHEGGIELQLTEETGFGKLVRDPELFWIYDSTRPEINSWGFKGEEIESPKPDGVFRILYLGDSCADMGDPPYPRIVGRLLNRSGGVEGDRTVETVSLAIAGYTSHQGLVAARKYGARVDPDLVVMHFGWNDHWLAYGAPDGEIEPPGGLDVLSDAAYRSSRLLQWAHLQWSRLGETAEESLGEGGGDTSARPADLRNILGSQLQRVSRVPPDRYRENLLEIARLFGEREVPVLFVTPPSSHRALGTPSHFVDLDYAVDSEAVVAMHDDYVEIVREVSRESHQPLLDLAGEVESLEPAELERIFLFDGIHYRPAGHVWVARRLVRYLRDELGL